MGPGTGGKSEPRPPEESTTRAKPVYKFTISELKNIVNPDIALREKLYYNGAMKPLSHPKIEDVTVEGILHAFSNPARIRIYAELAAAECSQICSAYREIAGVKLPKSTLSQHFSVLREAGLIRSVRKGTEVHNETRCAELKERFGPMIESIIGAYIQTSKNKKKKKK